MYLNEQIPMVCLGCLENKYFSLDLIFCVGKFCTEPSGKSLSSSVYRNPQCTTVYIQGSCSEFCICSITIKKMYI